MSETADEDDLRSCENCGTQVHYDDICHHGQAHGLCKDCSETWIAEVFSCGHDWMRHESGYTIADEYGDEGFTCKRCGVFFDHEFAMRMQPFICDGWVEILEPSP